MSQKAKLRAIIIIVLQITGINKDAFYGNTQVYEVVMARQIASYFAIRELNLDMKVIQRIIGRKTVNYSYYKIKNLLRNNERGIKYYVHECQKLIGKI